MTISDLENVECGEAPKYGNPEYSDFIAMLKGEIEPQQFLDSLNEKNPLSAKTDSYQISLFDMV
jgi:hypothetical protein